MNDKPLEDWQRKAHAAGLEIIKSRKPMNQEQIDALIRTCAPYKHGENCFPEDWEDIAIDLLATIRHRDELIRWADEHFDLRERVRAVWRDDRSVVMPEERDIADDWLAIVEAGDG